MQAMGSEKRRHERIQLSSPLKAIDTLSGDCLGLLVNVSFEGLMLIGEKPVVDGAVYQVEIPLGDEGAQTLSAGIECLWSSEADSEDKNWSGYRIIDISEDGKLLLEKIVSQL